MSIFLSIIIVWTIIFILYYLFVYRFLGIGEISMLSMVVIYFALPYFVYIFLSSFCYGLVESIIPSWYKYFKRKLSKTKTYYDPWLNQIITVHKNNIQYKNE